VAGGGRRRASGLQSDPATGALTFIEGETYGANAHGIDRPSSLVLRRRRHLYVAGHDDDASRRSRVSS